MMTHTDHNTRARRATLYDSASMRREQSPARESGLVKLKRKQLVEQSELGMKHRSEARALEDRQRGELNGHFDVRNGGPAPRDMVQRHVRDREQQRVKHGEERRDLAAKHDAEIAALDPGPGR